jgi:branched-chain amino acid transport system substrate-binding protein
LGSALALASRRNAAAAAPKVKIGAIMPSSGVLAFPGQQCVRGVNFGGKLADEKFGVTLEIEHADTQSKPENGRVAAENLIRRGCKVLIGAWDSGATISALQVAEAAKIPMVVHIASAPQVTEQGFTQVFRIYPKATDVVRESLVLLKDVVAKASDKPAGAAIMHVNNTFGNATADAIDKFWDEVGLSIKRLTKISYDERTKDLSVEVAKAKAKASGADALISVTRTSDAIMIVREMVKQGWTPKISFAPNSNGLVDKSFYDALGKYADDGTASVPWFNARNPASVEVAKRFERETPGEKFDVSVAFALEAVMVAADAIKRAASDDPAAIHAALKTTDLPLTVLYGKPTKFDSAGQNYSIGTVLLQSRNGGPLVVAPSEVAAAEVRYPLTAWNKR